MAVDRVCISKYELYDSTNIIHQGAFYVTRTPDMRQHNLFTPTQAKLHSIDVQSRYILTLPAVNLINLWTKHELYFSIKSSMSYPYDLVFTYVSNACTLQ